MPSCCEGVTDKPNALRPPHLTSLSRVYANGVKVLSLCLDGSVSSRIRDFTPALPDACSQAKRSSWHKFLFLAHSLEPLEEVPTHEVLALLCSCCKFLQFLCSPKRLGSHISLRAAAGHCRFFRGVCELYKGQVPYSCVAIFSSVMIIAFVNIFLSFGAWSMTVVPFTNSTLCVLEDSPVISSLQQENRYKEEELSSGLGSAGHD